VTCDVGEASNVVIGWSMDQEMCSDKSFHFHWFLGLFSVTYLCDS